MKTLKYYILPFLKIILLCCIGLYFYKNIDKDQLWFYLEKITSTHIFLAVLSLWSAMFLTAYRWRMILKASVHLNLSFLEAFIPVMRGYVLSQVLPSSIGGDAYKIYFLQKFKSVFDAFIVVITDRLWGVIVCFILGCGFLPFYADSLYQSSVGKFMILAYCVFIFGLIGGFILKNILALRWSKIKQITDILDGTLAHPNFIKIFCVSLLIAFLLSLTPYIISDGMHLDLSLGFCCIVMPLVFIATALPISFSGWGVRETMFALFLSVMGVKMEKAVALSLLYGMILLISTLPLSLFFIPTIKNNRKI